MSWLRLHPYAAVCALVGIVLIIGAFFIESRTAAQPGGLSVWGGSGAPLLNPTSYAPNVVLSELRPSGQGTGVSPVYIPPPQTTDAEAPSGSGTFDMASFLAALSRPQNSSGTKAGGSAEAGLAYSFIPRGLIATTTPQPERSESQQKLYNYGNDAGSYIQTYEDSNRNAAAALRDQAEDRQNEQKKQAVKLVAMAMRTAGESLLGMEELPPEVAGVHAALAESYLDAGRALEKVPGANGDEAFIAAINAYNAAADALVKNYIALATQFSVSGVVFSQQDPGSVFTFSGGGGL